jgi:hypothetical protein
MQFCAGRSKSFKTLGLVSCIDERPFKVYFVFLPSSWLSTHTHKLQTTFYMRRLLPGMTALRFSRLGLWRLVDMYQRRGTCPLYEESSRFFWNVGTYVPDYVVPHYRSLPYSESLAMQPFLTVFSAPNWHRSRIYFNSCFVRLSDAVSYFYERCKLEVFESDIVGIIFWPKGAEAKCWVLCNVYAVCERAGVSLVGRRCWAFYTVPRNCTQWLVSYFAWIVGLCIKPIVVSSLGYKAKNPQVAISILYIALTMEISTVASLYFYTCGILKCSGLTEVLPCVYKT